jgi:hypothetical protein
MAPSTSEGTRISPLARTLARRDFLSDSLSVIAPALFFLDEQTIALFQDNDAVVFIG